MATNPAPDTSASTETTSLVNNESSVNVKEFAEKIKKVGIGKIVSGCISVVAFVIVTAFNSGDVYGMSKILYMTVAGSLFFILSGTVALYVAKHPSIRKVVVVLYLGLIGLIYELIVMGFLIDFFVHHRGIFKDKKGKHMAAIVGGAALWTVIGAIKVIHGAVILYYAIKTKVAHSALDAF